MRRQVPFIQQMERTDCAAACLAMTLAFHGKWVDMDEVRQRVGAGRDGASALAIVRAARLFGLEARGVRAEPRHLGQLPAGSILHWELNHFVVFERVTRRGVWVLDPAIGRRLIAPDRFNRSFTGVLVLLEPAEAFRPGGRRRRHLWRHLRTTLSHRRIVGQAAWTAVLIQAFALALPVLIGVLVDRVVPTGDRRLLAILAAGFGMIVAFHLVAHLVRAHLLLELRTRLDQDVSLGFVRRLTDLPYSFFVQRSVGDLMTRMSSIAYVREALTSTTLAVFLDGMVVALYVILLLLESVLVGTVVVVLGLLQVVTLAAIRDRVRRLTLENLQAQAEAYTYLAQMLVGMETLKVAGAEPRAVEHWSGRFVEQSNALLRRDKVAALADAALATLRLGSPLAVLVLGGYLVLDGSLPLGRMLALNALAAGFIVPLSGLITTVIGLQWVTGYLARVNDVLDAPVEEAPRAHPAPRLLGHLRVEDLSFRYGPNAPMVLRDVCVEVESGQTVAIVGRSGSGKSTFLNLLLGLYPPTSGRILLDGTDLAGLQPRSVRRQIGMVPQRPYLIGSTIRESIALLDPDLPLDRVVAAAEAAAVHEDIMAMPMQYETLLGDGGQSLSGGQRQRIALARTLVQRPAMLILDEATSELDPVTESRVYTDLEGLDCTKIIVAHRPRSVAAADLILVFEDGRIVERGTHEDLLALHGMYEELVRKAAAPLKGGEPAERGTSGDV